MEVSSHVRNRWAIRGDYERTAASAWANGTKVRLPNYNYGSARYDYDTDLVFISNGDKITTVIRKYEHNVVIPLEDVECNECGTEFQQMETCPSCGRKDWS